MCPLCNKPVPTPRGEEPDFTVGKHIDNDCQFTEGKKVIIVYHLVELKILKFI
jgi:hypothetical protein